MDKPPSWWSVALVGLAGLAAIALKARAIPPLSESMVRAFAEFFAWGLDVKLTEPLYAGFRNHLDMAWRNQDRDQISMVLRAIELHRELLRMPPKDRDAHREDLQANLVQQLKQSSAPLARMLLEAHGTRQGKPSTRELGGRILRDHVDYTRISSALMRNWKF